MKKPTKINFALCVFLFIGICQAQKIGYVDSKYILENYKEYINSKKYVKKEIEEWNTELKAMKLQYEKEKSDFLNEKILLTKDQIEETEKKIEEKRKKIIDFENEKFSPEGKMIMSQLTIINPIQNKLWRGVQAIAKRRGLSMILDKGNQTGPTIIYADPRYDITTDVLDYMNDPKSELEKIKKNPFDIDLDKQIDKVLPSNSNVSKKTAAKVDSLQNEANKTIDKINNNVDKLNNKIDKTNKVIDKTNTPTKTLSEKIKEMQENKNK